jgi:hypothetical protein
MMFCPPAVDVAASETDFRTEYPLGATKLTPMVCVVPAARVVDAGLATHDAIEPHDGASVSGSAMLPAFVTLKLVDPTALRRTMVISLAAVSDRCTRLADIVYVVVVVVTCPERSVAEATSVSGFEKSTSTDAKVDVN